ncbi:MAG: hypothetical protein ACRENP_23670 [Longimicrobiales bacterium]
MNPAKALPALLGATLLCTPVQAQQDPPNLRDFLQREVGLTAAELQTAATAQPVTKVVSMAGPRDIGVFGMIAVAAPRSFLVGRVKDFPQYLRGPTRTRMGLFDAPAQAGNVQSVLVTPEDVKELRSCKPGDCSFKLPASEMKQLREKSAGSEEAAAAIVTAYVRLRMMEFVNDYRARGDAAMLVYDDRGGVEASRALRELAATPRFLYQYVPEFQQYLDSYPRSKLERASDVVFWSRDELPSLRPILNITHVSVYTPTALPQMTLVSSKGIYANHYFQAALDILAIVERTDAPGTSYVLVLRRYRFDSLTAGIVNLRGRVTNAMRSLTTTDLQRFKTTYEALYRQSR